MNKDIGPAAIREQSQLLRPFNPPDFDFDPLVKLQVADWGDVDVVPGQIEDAFGKIERVIGAPRRTGTVGLLRQAISAGFLTPEAAFEAYQQMKTCGGYLPRLALSDFQG